MAVVCPVYALSTITGAASFEGLAMKSPNRLLAAMDERLPIHAETVDNGCFRILMRIVQVLKAL
jgi:hypothetical protein